MEPWGAKGPRRLGSSVGTSGRDRPGAGGLLLSVGRHLTFFGPQSPSCIMDRDWTEQSGADTSVFCWHLWIECLFCAKDTQQ